MLTPQTKWLEKSASAGTKLHSAGTLSEIRTLAASEIDEERREFRNKTRALREIKTKKSKDPLKAKERDSDESWQVVDDVSLRVNYDKYNVLIRNELLIKAAGDRWNKAVGEVLRAVLAASLEHQSEPREMRTEHPVGLTSIVAQIPVSSHKLLIAGMAGQSSKSLPEIVRQYLAVMSGDDLASDVTGARFLTHSDHSNSPMYYVEIENICTALKAALLQELVRDRIDERAARVLAVVARAHFASETMVRDCAMIPLREARQILSELQKLSLIDIQEVPKTAAKGRSPFPGADYHLWGIDLRKAYGFLLSGVYKTLANLVQRHAREVERRAVLLAKIDRPDLIAEGIDINAALSVKDQADLAELNNAQTMLALAETRTELVVMMLRDLPGGIPQR
jgi:DNA-directed RNA polymerase III subunit RPC3